MKSPLFVRPLAEAERIALRQGLRSPDAFTLRRCQILGRRTPRLAVLASGKSVVSNEIQRVSEMRLVIEVT